MVWFTSLTSSVLVVTLLALLIAERRRQAALRSQLDALAELVGVLEGSEWQHAAQDLLNHAAMRRLLKAALLYAVSDSGDLEQRAAVQAPGAGAFSAPPDEPALRRALEETRPTPWGDLLLYPLRHQGEGIGVLAVQAPGQTPVLVMALADLTGISLSEVRYLRRQAALSNTDGLTGLANHRHFQQSLTIALGQVYLESETVALILADIDHFKAVNDTYGHQCGDLVLREIGYLLRTSVPPTALVARYGGEEMVVVLHGEDARRAAAVAETLRQRVEGHEFRDTGSGTRLHVTISLGVAVFELGEGKNQFVARCDGALYASKRGGRNRVTVAPAGESVATASAGFS